MSGYIHYITRWTDRYPLHPWYCAQLIEPVPGGPVETVLAFHGTKPLTSLEKEFLAANPRVRVMNCRTMGTEGNFPKLTKLCFEDAMDRGATRMVLQDDDSFMPPEFNFYGMVMKCLGKKDEFGRTVAMCGPMTPYKMAVWRKTPEDGYFDITKKHGATYGMQAYSVPRLRKVWPKLGPLLKRLKFRMDVPVSILLQEKGFGVVEFACTGYKHRCSGGGKKKLTEDELVKHGIRQAYDFHATMEVLGKRSKASVQAALELERCAVVCFAENWRRGGANSNPPKSIAEAMVVYKRYYDGIYGG